MFVLISLNVLHWVSLFSNMVVAVVCDICPNQLLVFSRGCLYFNVSRAVLFQGMTFRLIGVHDAFFRNQVC